MDIHDPENLTVVDGYSLARNYERIMAFIIDAVLFILSYLLLFKLLSPFNLEWVAGVVAFSYLIFRDNLPKKQSIGKKIMKLKVINSHDEFQLSFLGALKRNFIFIPAVLIVLGESYIYMIIVFSALFILLELYFLYTSSDNQRLGDQFANTLVIENPL